MIRARDIYDYAESLYRGLDQMSHPEKEVCIRGIISKSYYSVYHAVHENEVVNTDGYAPDKSLHQQTRRSMASKNPYLYNLVSSLLEGRKVADYRLENCRQIKERASDALERASEALEAIEKLKGKRY